ncbi:hypothetical protein ACQP00_33325 [Dactylosporangium sp. CS-047395]|uniref:hypothetical protein n=1 Tax=Dactylosporangium sp. CS-047395 TaxID=3239936 RepID=UPI003D936F72
MITYGTAEELAAALRRAAEAHGVHEKALGHFDEGWPDWYARFMMDESRSIPSHERARRGGD